MTDSLVINTADQCGGVGDAPARLMATGGATVENMAEYSADAPRSRQRRPQPHFAAGTRANMGQ